MGERRKEQNFPLFSLTRTLVTRFSLSQCLWIHFPLHDTLPSHARTGYVYTH